MPRTRPDGALIEEKIDVALPSTIPLPVTLTLARNAVQRNTHPLVWDPGFVTVLQLPAWGLFGLVGVLFAYAGRRRREVNIFAN